MNQPTDGLILLKMPTGLWLRLDLPEQARGFNPELVVFVGDPESRADWPAFRRVLLPLFAQGTKEVRIA